MLLYIRILKLCNIDLKTRGSVIMLDNPRVHDFNLRRFYDLSDVLNERSHVGDRQTRRGGGDMGGGPCVADPPRERNVFAARIPVCRARRDREPRSDR